MHSQFSKRWVFRNAAIEYRQPAQQFMDIHRSALSMVIHKQGDVTEWDVTDLIQRYQAKKGITLDKERYWQAVRVATEQYKSNVPCLYMCTDSRCLTKAYLSPTGASLEQLSAELGCRVEPTGCQWQCEEAPMLTMKTASGAESLFRINSAESWQAAQVVIRNKLNPQD